MIHKFSPRFSIALKVSTTFDRPTASTAPFELIRMDNPALDVMTDFRFVKPQTTRPDVSIDDALEMMKIAGVRLLLVIDGDEQIIGLISAKDIQGERPIKLTEETRINHADIRVEMIMTPQRDIKVLSMKSIQDAQVGHIIETMRQLDCQHILAVIEDEATGIQRVRGLFSASQISKQLGRDIMDNMIEAHSLYEIVHEVDHS